MNTLLHSEVAHFVLYIAASSAIGAMPAPTATSHMFYQWLFKFLNTFAGNLTRAFGTKVESSPNFIPAAVKAVDLGVVAKPSNPPNV